MSSQVIPSIVCKIFSAVIFCFIFVGSAFPVLAAPYGEGIYGTGAYNVGDGTAPSISLTALSPDPNTDTTPALTGTATDAAGTVTAVQYQMDGTGGSWTACTAIDGTFDEASEAFTCTFTSTLSDGLHTIHVRATDSNNNTTGSSSYSTDTFTIDATAPSAPGSPSTTTPTNSTSQTWTFAAATDATAGIASYAYRVLDSLSNLITSGTNTTRTVITNLAEGVYTFFVKAIDNAGNQGSESSGSVTVDTSAPTISSVSASTNETGATITWATNEASSSKVNYGLTNSYGSTTSETDTSPRVTSHSVSLTNLIGCTTYYYRVRSIDAVTNERVGTETTFTTAGCAGSASVDSQTQSAITTASGGSLDLLSASKGIALTVPASFALTDANFQIKQLEKSAVQTETSRPTGKTLVASYLYDLKALSDISTTITSFNNPITITMTYGSADMVGIDEATLKIWRWDGSSWHQLSDCVTDTNARTVTCTTSAFSVFGLFGTSTVPDPTPTPTTQSSSSSNSSGGSSSQSTGPTVCSGQRPGSAPQLFQIDRESGTAHLYITPASNPYNRYIVSYGIGSNTEQYSTSFEYRDAKGVITYPINHLDQKTPYSFKVQAANGCVTGDWSNTLVVSRLKGARQSFYRSGLTQMYLKTKASIAKVASPKSKTKTQVDPAQKTDDTQPTVAPTAVQSTSSPVSGQTEPPAPQQQEKKRSWFEWLWPF